MDKMLALNYICRVRRSARKIVFLLDHYRFEIRSLRRRQKILEKSGNPFLIKRSSLLEPHISDLESSRNNCKDILLEIAGELLSVSGAIDAILTTSDIMSALNVNPVDRVGIDSVGIIELAYAHSLENSATHRGDDWKSSPLAQAITEYFMHEYLHNEEYKRAANDMLFGKGGMFEFLPRYNRTPDGEFVRQRPNLRLADSCDIK